ncbi:hypothetical protein ABIE33_006746 [Ensifer sp. 4252]
MKNLLPQSALGRCSMGSAEDRLELLADAFVKLTDHDQLSRETVRRRLAENDLKPWRKAKVTERPADFAHCMRDLVDVHYPGRLHPRGARQSVDPHTRRALSSPAGR